MDMQPSYRSEVPIAFDDDYHPDDCIQGERFQHVIGYVMIYLRFEAS